MVEASTLAQPQPAQAGTAQASGPAKLYDSFGMNPRMIRFYLAEKGIDVPRHEVDILGAENRRADYAGRSGGSVADAGAIGRLAYCRDRGDHRISGRTPSPAAAHRLDTPGTAMAGCGGGGSRSRSAVQWSLAFIIPKRSALSEPVRCYPEQASAQKEIARTGMRWLNGAMNEPWLAGDRFTVADIASATSIRPIGRPSRRSNPRSLVHRDGGARPNIWRDRRWKRLNLEKF